MKFKKLRFGTAGIPFSTPNRNTVNGVKHVRDLGLEAMELQFVRSVNLNEESAKEVNTARKQNDVVLTCHGSYFINLNAKEPQKRGASRSRALQAADIANKAGAFSLTFHASYYLGMEKEQVYNNTKEQLKKILKEVQDNGNPIWIRPETTGKPTQFGTLKEIIRLSQELEQVMPCVDFAHLHARDNGINNTSEEFHSILKEIENGLGKEGLNNMHIHMSGIEYGLKGEKHHLILKDSDFNYEELLRKWKEFKIKGVVVSESPNLEGDARLMKETYEKL